MKNVAASYRLSKLSAVVAALLFFQVHVPIQSALLNLNLADPLALLGLAAFILTATTHAVSWRVPGVFVVVLGCTGVMTLALFIGYSNHGWIQWAWINKYAGWFVLLAFAASGALSQHFAAERSLKTFIFVFNAVGALAIGQQCLVNLDIVAPTPLVGFAQNSNAFPFQALMVLCAVFALGNRRLLPMAIIPAACILLSGSRSAFGTLVIVLIVCFVYIPGKTLKVIAVAAGGAFTLSSFTYCRSWPYSLAARRPGVHAYQLGLPFAASYTQSNAEHYQTIARGISMFLEHPAHAPEGIRPRRGGLRPNDHSHQ